MSNLAEIGQVVFEEEIEYVKSKRTDRPMDNGRLEKSSLKLSAQVSKTI
jgi:hypothetical protein